jgi:hypothetical protein
MRCLLSTVDLDTPHADGSDEPAYGLEHPQIPQTSSSPPTNDVSVTDPTPQSSADPQNPHNSEKEKSSGVLKSTLESIDVVLNVLNDVASFVPVAGFGVAVPIAQTIVKQFRVSPSLSWLFLPYTLD